MTAYQWNIFIAILDPVRGSEQAGRRPVLVISNEKINQLLPVVNILPLTSLKSATAKIYPNEVLLPASQTNLPQDSIVLCYQVRTLDKTRLGNQIGQVTNRELQKQIKTALKFQLEL